MVDRGTKFLREALLTLALMPAGASKPPKPAGFGGAGEGAPTTSVSLFAGRYGGAQEKPDDKPSPTAQNTPAATASPADTTDDALQAALQRRRVTETLIEQAQNDFKHVARLSDDSYSQDLRQRQKSLNAYLRKHNPSISHVVMIDPNEFDAGMALGLSPDATTHKILDAQHVKVSDPVFKDIISSVKTDDDNAFSASHSYTQDPSTHFDYWNPNPQVCVIVPTSAYSPEVQIKGLSYQENIDFINSHESWHCKDNKYLMSAVPEAAANSIDPYHLEKTLGNPDQLKAISIGNHQESLADVGAAGDMIRKGADPSIIDHIAADRFSSPDDIIHYTGASLEALKAKISEMGIDRFRRLNDDQARKVYESAVDSSALTPAMTEVVIRYHSGSDGDRENIRSGAQNITTLEALMKTGAAIHDGADPQKTFDAALTASRGDEQTQKALTAMRDQVDKIGVDRFRSLDAGDEQAVRAAIDTVVPGHPDMSKSAAGYWTDSRGGRKDVLAKLDETRAALPRALATMDAYHAPAADASAVTALNAQEREVFRQVGEYKATQLLQDRAFSDAGKITPATLAHAYGEMQEDLAGQLKKSPDDPLLRAKVSKLQQSFVTTVHDLDYVKVNADRGVNIFEVEASLSRFLQNPKVADAPQAAPADKKPSGGDTPAVHAPAPAPGTSAPQQQAPPKGAAFARRAPPPGTP